MQDPRTLAAVWAAKAAASLSRGLGRGGGTAISGLVGLGLQPDLIERLAVEIANGCAVVTGTNGKTTTARLLAEICRHAGLSPLANASGSNLVRGLTATLTQAVDLTGRLRSPEHNIGVFEVDEATLPLVLPALKPRAVGVTNLFRDQLDRYGEVEAVAELWRNCIARAPAGTRLVLNADDPSVAALAEGRNEVIYFGLNDPGLTRACIEHASDALSCRCGARLTYEAVYFGHLGIWRCDACGRARPEPDFCATRVDLRDGRRLGFELQPQGVGIEMPIGGLYNLYNGLAATALAAALGLNSASIESGLSSTAAAFGRQELFEVHGRRVELFLAKNPAGTNQVLDTLRRDPERKTLLVILNDGIADGRDISWIWDADFETTAQQFAATVVSGSRAAEMALRLKYAEWPEQTLAVVPEIPGALDAALAATPVDACLTVMPTYTAMLTVRELLAQRSGREPFWRL
jgi:UDP-N-acetylmuramyl tripeptide synthase